jgi:hypothetical protein
VDHFDFCPKCETEVPVDDQGFCMHCFIEIPKNGEIEE